MPTKINIEVDQKFGNWRVLSRDGEKIKCVCEACNKTIKLILKYHLTSGKSRSCGCIKEELRQNSRAERYNSEEAKNSIKEKLLRTKQEKLHLTKKGVLAKDQIVGKWLLLEDPKVKSSTILGRCLVCNKTEQQIQIYNLLKGRTNSCGCEFTDKWLETRKNKSKNSPKGKIKAGDIFNSLKVLTPPKTGINEKNIKCECLGCGKIITTRYEYLLDGTTKSCGCKKTKYRKETCIKNYGVEHVSQLPENRNKLKEWCEENPDKLFTSKPEQEILDWVKEFYPSARKHKENGHEIDIFIPELNLGLEHNGIYWHCELHKERDYHFKKTSYFKEKQIKIIHIWEHLWRDRKDQVRSFLRSALKLNENRLAARKCVVIWSNDSKEIEASNSLLDTTHIQGKGRATKWVANAYYQDELLATASFAKHHRNSKDWVLTRFTTKENYTIQGILGKLSKIAYDNLQTKIVSWADFSLSDGNGYEKAGWKFEQKLPIDYFYYSLETKKVVSKQSRQKRAVGTPAEMTELEHATLDGLVRVWDCGKIRFSFS